MGVSEPDDASKVVELSIMCYRFKRVIPPGVAHYWIERSSRVRSAHPRLWRNPRHAPASTMGAVHPASGMPNPEIVPSDPESPVPEPVAGADYFVAGGSSRSFGVSLPIRR